MGKSKVRSNNLSGIMAGTGSALLICILGLAALTQLILSETMGERGAEIAIPFLLFLSTLIGCLLSCHLADEKWVISMTVTTAIFTLVLLVTGLTMDGSFDKVLLKIGSIAAGIVVSCVFCLKKSGKTKHRKRHYR